MIKTISFFIKKIPLPWWMLVIFFYLSFGALGFPIIVQKCITHEFCVLSPTKQGLLQALVLASIFYILKKSHRRKWFLWLIIPYFLMSWLYLPQAIMYGGMSMGIVASLFETNATETLEYILSLPWFVYVVWVGYLILFLNIILPGSGKREAGSGKREAGSGKREAGSGKRENYTLYILNAIIIFIALKDPLSELIKNKKALSALSYSKHFPLKFFTDAINNVQPYLAEKKLINNELNQQANWKIINNNQKYKNYVLIIGESMRKDYMSLYGYPFSTTPFLQQVNGIIFENYISAAPNTQPSLNRTLYATGQSDKIIYARNIISLAKQANIKIYWLSNQGVIGQYDTAASRLGKRADYSFFTKKLGYETQKNFDIELLPQLTEILSRSESDSRLIILHLMGSHPTFCERLHDELKLKLINREMSCYLQSIMQTDDFIRQTNEILKNQGEPYSVIYFSDHGLSSKKGSDGIWNNNIYKQNYEVPFIRFDSDSKERTIIHSPKSAFDFMNGFAEWLGIEEKTLSQQPSFFEDKQNGKIRVFNWHEMVDFDTLADDPPLPPTPIK